MRNLLFFLASCVFLLACSGSYELDASGFAKASEDLKSRFGAEAWYTSIVLKTEDAGKAILTVDVTDDPNSLRQSQWVRRGDWEKSADLTVRIESGKPEDYMFQLDREVSLQKMGTLLEKASQTLKEETGVADAQLRAASVITKNEIRDKQQGTVYTFSFYSPGDQKNYSLVYSLSGELLQLHR